MPKFTQVLSLGSFQTVEQVPLHWNFYHIKGIKTHFHLMPEIPWDLRAVYRVTVKISRYSSVLVFQCSTGIMIKWCYSSSLLWLVTHAQRLVKCIDLVPIFGAKIPSRPACKGCFHKLPGPWDPYGSTPMYTPCMCTQCIIIAPLIQVGVLLSAENPPAGPGRARPPDFLLYFESISVHFRTTNSPAFHALTL